MCPDSLPFTPAVRLPPRQPQLWLLREPAGHCPPRRTWVHPEPRLLSQPCKLVKTSWEETLRSLMSLQGAQDMTKVANFLLPLFRPSFLQICKKRGMNEAGRPQWQSPARPVNAGGGMNEGWHLFITAMGGGEQGWAQLVTSTDG